MTPITATSPAIQPLSVTQTVAVGTSILSAGSAALVSSDTGAASVGTTPTQSSDALAEQRVDSVVAAVKDHNDIADALSHFSWERYAQLVGTAKATAVKAEMYKYIDYSTAHISVTLGNGGIPIQPVSDQQAADDGIAQGSLLIGSFSFKLGGSTYAVTAGKDGNLVGTKDGQAWKTWQVLPPSTTSVDASAATALSTLQALVEKARDASQPARAMNIVA